MIGSELRATGLAVIRAGQAPNGAFVASPSFSQYGYAWLRDGAFIAEALDTIGEGARAARFHEWVAGVVAGSTAGIERAIVAGRAGRRPAPTDYLHCRYTIDGAPGPEDWPTFQLDGPGIWLWALGRHVAMGGDASPDVLAAAVNVGRYLAALWPTPSSDAWEEFASEVHTSTLAADLAGLRAVHDLSRVARAAPAVADAMAAIESRLFGSAAAAGVGRAPTPWTKWPGTDLVDASLLWIAGAYELTPADDPRFAATLAQIERDLIDEDGGVHRYRDDTYYGGGAWLLLTAALGRVYLRRGDPGDIDRARACLAWIEAQADPLGHLPEQVATRAFHPDRVDEWRTLWGDSASPLLWSHATHLALAAELGRAVSGSLDAAGMPRPAEAG